MKNIFAFSVADWHRFAGFIPAKREKSAAGRKRSAASSRFFPTVPRENAKAA